MAIASTKWSSLKFNAKDTVCDDKVVRLTVSGIDYKNPLQVQFQSLWVDTRLVIN